MSEYSPEDLCEGKPIFPRQLCHFPACNTHGSGTFSGEKDADMIAKLQKEFDHRFADKTRKSHVHIFANPFTFHVEDAPVASSLACCPVC